MNSKRTVCITIETSRFSVTLRGTSARAWCEQCASEVDMVPLESAAELARVDSETIRHWLDHQQFHGSQSGGPVRICLNLLFNAIRKKSVERDFDKSSGIPALEG